MPTPAQNVASSSLACPLALSLDMVGSTAATAAKNITPARTRAPFGLTWASTMVLRQGGWNGDETVMPARSPDELQGHMRKDPDMGSREGELLMFLATRLGSSVKKKKKNGVRYMYLRSPDSCRPRRGVPLSLRAIQDAYVYIRRVDKSATRMEPRWDAAGYGDSKNGE